MRARDTAVIGLLLGIVVGWLAATLRTPEPEPRGAPPPLPDSDRVEVIRAEPGPEPEVAEAEVEPEPSVSKPEMTPQEFYEELRRRGTPYDSLVLDFLRAYPNESYTHLINRSMNGLDEKRRVLAHNLFMMSQEDPIGHALDHLSNKYLGPPDISAALIIGYYRDLLSDDDRATLWALTDTRHFPASGAAAFALERSGDPGALEAWVEETRRQLRGGRVDERDLRKLVRVTKQMAGHTAAVLPLMREVAELDSGSGKIAREFLESFQEEPEDLEELVRHALEQATRRSP